MLRRVGRFVPMRRKTRLVGWALKPEKATSMVGRLVVTTASLSGEMICSDAVLVGDGVEARKKRRVGWSTMGSMYSSKLPLVEATRFHNWKLVEASSESGLGVSLVTRTLTVSGSCGEMASCWE